LWNHFKNDNRNDENLFEKEKTFNKNDIKRGIEMLAF